MQCTAAVASKDYLTHVGTKTAFASLLPSDDGGYQIDADGRPEATKKAQGVRARLVKKGSALHAASCDGDVRPDPSDSTQCENPARAGPRSTCIFRMRESLSHPQPTRTSQNELFQGPRTPRLAG